jgi:hypothetical protein
MAMSVRRRSQPSPFLGKIVEKHEKKMEAPGSQPESNENNNKKEENLAENAKGISWAGWRKEGQEVNRARLRLERVVSQRDRVVGERAGGMMPRA